MACPTTSSSPTTSPRPYRASMLPMAGCSPSMPAKSASSCRSRPCPSACCRPSSPPRTSASSPIPASTSSASLRAVVANLANPGKRPEGASGITQQVAKNFLLNNQATLARKIREAILAFRIEDDLLQGPHPRALSQRDLSRMRATTASPRRRSTISTRSLGQLTLSEIAYLAGAAQGAEPLQHLANEKEAYARRDYVLGRMREDGYITADEEKAAKAEKLAPAQARRHRGRAGRLLRRGGPPQPARRLWREGPLRGRPDGDDHARSGHPGGRRQGAARRPDRLRPPPWLARPLRQDRRHGACWEEEFARLAQRRPLYGPPTWQLAVVTKVEAAVGQIAGLPDGEGTIPFAEMHWARPTLPDQRVGGFPGRPANVVSVGDVVVVEKVEKPTGRAPTPSPIRRRPTRCARSPTSTAAWW